MGAQEKLTTLLVAIIIVAFFMPWLTVESGAVGGITKILTGKRQPVLDSISGFRIPLLANSKDARFMISVIKVFNPQIRDADKKSYLIWGVPLIAILISLASRVFKYNRIVRLFLGVIAIAMTCAVVYKISNTDLDKLVLKVNIAYGLWLTLFGFLTVGISELSSFLVLGRVSAKAAAKTQVQQSGSRVSIETVPETTHKKSKQGTFLKLIGFVLIIFIITTGWARLGLASGFDYKQTALLVLGLVLALCGLILSKRSQ